MLRKLDRFRKKRNLGGYVMAGAVSLQESAEMRQTAIRLREQVVDWLEREHPHILAEPESPWDLLR